MEDTAEIIKNVYKKAGAEDKLAVEWYPVGHMFNLEMQKEPLNGWICIWGTIK